MNYDDDYAFRVAIAEGVIEELRGYHVDVVKPICDYSLEIHKLGSRPPYIPVKMSVYDKASSGEYYIIVKPRDGGDNLLFFGIEDPGFFARVAAEILRLLDVKRNPDGERQETGSPPAQG